MVTAEQGINVLLSVFVFISVVAHSTKLAAAAVSASHTITNP